MYQLKKGLVVLCLLCSFQSFSQDQPRTLFGGADSTQMSTFFWGPEIRMHFHGSRMRETASFLFGGKVGKIINRKMIVGVGGWAKPGRTTFYGHYRDEDDNGQIIDVPNQKMAVSYFYGGLILGVVANSNKPVHYSFTTLLGGGTSNEYVIEPDGDHGTTFNSPGFLVAEPAFMVEFNLTKHIRLETGLAYRWMSGARFQQLSTRDLSGLTVPIALKFGNY